VYVVTKQVRSESAAGVRNQLRRRCVQVDYLRRCDTGTRKGCVASGNISPSTAREIGHFRRHRTQSALVPSGSGRSLGHVDAGWHKTRRVVLQRVYRTETNIICVAALHILRCTVKFLTYFCASVMLIEIVFPTPYINLLYYFRLKTHLFHKSAVLLLFIHRTHTVVFSCLLWHASDYLWFQTMC